MFQALTLPAVRQKMIRVGVIGLDSALADRLRPIAEIIHLDEDYSADALIDSIQDHQPDVILLGRGISYIEAIQFYRILKSSSRIADIPIVIFGPKDGGEDEIAAFAAGADDYVGRSIGSQALSARLKAQANRRVRHSAHRHTTPEEIPVRLGEIEIRPGSYTARVQG